MRPPLLLPALLATSFSVLSFGRLAASQHLHPAAATKPTATVAVPIGPAVLQNISSLPRTVEVTITASPTLLSLVPGATTSAYAYNGRVPGPLLEAHEGDKVIVHFINNLPESSTIHWHGLHIPMTSDGSPYHPVAPGTKRDYVFTLQPGSAGTYWYHPHPHEATGGQIARGLYGALIVRPAIDPLPAMTEKVLILSDNRFGPDGAIDISDPHSPQGMTDEVNGREGDVLFVNGEVMPDITIRSGETQRWRIVNASAARVYRLAIAGHALVHVANDGGLFERPVTVQEIVLSSSERVEVLVRGTGAPGSKATLQTLPYDRYVPQTRPANWNQARDLLTLRYTAEPAIEPVALPASMRVVPAIDAAQATKTRVLTLSQGLINGRLMDMNRSDIIARLGATEIWKIENIVGMDHPFHLHGFQFQVLDRNGVPEPFRSWKDTVNVPKHESVRFIVRFDDFPGKWMFHCHILDHEDRGMMGVLEVRSPRR